MRMASLWVAGITTSWSSLVPRLSQVRVSMSSTPGTPRGARGHSRTLAREGVAVAERAIGASVGRAGQRRRYARRVREWAAEVSVDEALARRLIGTQFP